MNDLYTLQEAFQASILQGDDYAGCYISESQRVSAATRLAIYSDAYRLRLIDALADNYPTLHALLGDDAFDRLARAYLVAYPSRHPSIRWFGHRLADFLFKYAPYRARPELPELAHFEWTLREVFDARDSDPLTIQQLSDLPAGSWPYMQIRLHDTVRRLDLCWNVPSIWAAVDRGEPPPAPIAAVKPQSWVLWRKELSQYFRSMDEDEAWALDAARDGQPFAALCEGLCRWREAERAPARAASLLKTWITEQMVSAVTIHT